MKLSYLITLYPASMKQINYCILLKEEEHATEKSGKWGGLGWGGEGDNGEPELACRGR